MDMTEKTLSSDIRFSGRILNTRLDTVRLPDGSTATREIIEHSGGVGILALTDDGQVVLVRQYRHPYSEIIYEIPAGKLEKGEDPLSCGKRELAEETGYSAGEWINLGQIYPSPGYCSEIIYIFLAAKLKKGIVHPDRDEFIEHELIPFDRAIEWIKNGQLKDAKTQISLLKAALMKERGEIL